MTPVRRWGPWVVLLAVAALSLAIGVQRPSHLSLQQRTMQLAGQVRCPVCNGESAAQSQAPEAEQIRQQIASSLAAGESSSAILAGLVHDFGPGILEQPQTHGVSLLVWVLPIAAVVVAAAGLGVVLGRWRRRVRSTADEADRSLVEQALGATVAPTSDRSSADSGAGGGSAGSGSGGPSGSSGSAGPSAPSFPPVPERS